MEEKEEEMDLYVFVHIGWEIRSRVGVGEGDGRRSGAMRTIKGSAVVAARHRRQSQHLMCVSVCIGNGIFILYLYQILGDFHNTTVAIYHDNNHDY